MHTCATMVTGHLGYLFRLLEGTIVLLQANVVVAGFALCMHLLIRRMQGLAIVPFNLLYCHVFYVFLIA